MMSMYVLMRILLRELLPKDISVVGKQNAGKGLLGRDCYIVVQG